MRIFCFEKVDFSLPTDDGAAVPGAKSQRSVEKWNNKKVLFNRNHDDCVGVTLALFWCQNELKTRFHQTLSGKI